MAWAKHVAGTGLSLAQIKEELLNGRVRKAAATGSSKYAERTAWKAVEQPEP